MESREFRFQERVDLAPDDERNEFDEDFCGNRLIRIYTDTFVAKVRFVATEQFLGCVSALIEGNRFPCGHFLRGNDDKVTAE